MRRPLLWLLVPALVGCAHEEPDGPAPEPPKGPDRIVSDFQLTETERGTLAWKLRAAEARHYRDQGQTHLSEVDVEFYRADGFLDSRLTSDRGMVVDETGDMLAEGSVVLVSTAGDTLQTEELRYLKAQDLLTGTGPVRIAKPDRVLTGIGFTARPDLSTYEVQKDVHIVLKDKREEWRDDL